MDFGTQWVVLLRRARLFNMVFRVQLVPISREPIQVTATTEPTSSSTAYCYVGAWRDIRGFIALTVRKGRAFADIENDLRKDLPVSFDIDATESALSLARFNAVKKL